MQSSRHRQLGHEQQWPSLQHCHPGTGAQHRHQLSHSGTHPSGCTPPSARAGLGVTKAATASTSEANSITARTPISHFCRFIAIHLPSSWIYQSLYQTLRHLIYAYHHLFLSLLATHRQRLQLFQRVGKASVGDHPLSIYHVEERCALHLILSGFTVFPHQDGKAQTLFLDQLIFPRTTSRTGGQRRLFKAPSGPYFLIQASYSSSSSRPVTSSATARKSPPVATLYL